MDRARPILREHSLGDTTNRIRGRGEAGEACPILLLAVSPRDAADGPVADMSNRATESLTARLAPHDPSYFDLLD